MKIAKVYYEDTGLTFFRVVETSATTVAEFQRQIGFDNFDRVQGIWDTNNLNPNCAEGFRMLDELLVGLHGREVKDAINELLTQCCRT